MENALLCEKIFTKYTLSTTFNRYRKSSYCVPGYINENKVGASCLQWDAMGPSGVETEY